MNRNQAPGKLTVLCRTKELLDVFQADVVPDLSAAELIDELAGVRYLPELARGERWRVFNARTGVGLALNARMDENVEDGDQLVFDRESNGAWS